MRFGEGLGEDAFAVGPELYGLMRGPVHGLGSAATQRLHHLSEQVSDLLVDGATSVAPDPSPPSYR